MNGVGRKIEPERDASGQPLDLSFAHLRSVSPIHLEYLRNMGVAASMSLSIIVDGELWGLVACHHYTPRTVTMVHRVASAMFVEFLSQHLVVIDNRQRFDAALRTRRQLDALVSEMSFQETIDVFLRDRLVELAQLIPNDGVGLWLNGVWSSIGSTPPPSQIPALKACRHAAGHVHLGHPSSCPEAARRRGLCGASFGCPGNPTFANSA